MGQRHRIYELIFFLAFMITIKLEAVTVPICPTNKIAPHRRITNRDYGHARTFGAFYDLLGPNSPQFQGDAPQRPLNDLVERPQEDDPDDCGEIEDYDENDLSSILPQVQRRQEKTFFPEQYRPPQNYPVRPSTIRPQRPTRPQRPQFPNYAPTRPPYWSGGFFGTNDYRPPLPQYPSDYIKPIHEYSEDFQAPYRPNLVGGPSGHIVGASPARPTTTDFEATTSRPFFPNRTPRNGPERTTFRPYTSKMPPSTPRPVMYPIRGQRPRNMNSNGILGSFVDLLFK